MVYLLVGSMAVLTGSETVMMMVGRSDKQMVHSKAD